MDAVVIGARGLLGQDIVKEGERRGWSLLTPRRDDLDITRQESIAEYFSHMKPDWIINCAAYVEVDKAEEEQEMAFELNANGALAVARASLETGAKLVHISTDYVFDGSKQTPYTEDDETHPLGIYAESKLRGEQLIMSANPSSIIARTAWLYGTGRENFPSKILRAALEGHPLKIVADRVGSPTYTVDLSYAIAEMMDRSIDAGIYHVVNRGAASWHDIVREMLASANVNVPLERASNADYPTPAKRPLYSVLSGRKLAALNITLPTWQDAVRRYVKELRSRGAIPT